jgi:iron complex outermembrane receptor protein
MEERSPGSYRFSIRGSLLRSPFGVRNIKFYLDDFPLTDAGGNTYVNLIDKYFIETIEVFKGPDGSFYGANTGGAVLLKSFRENDDTVSARAQIRHGTFRTLYEGVNAAITQKKYRGEYGVSHFTSAGFRDNSASENWNFLASNRFFYSGKNFIDIVVLAAKLHYETPGGLTLEQALSDPTAARKASGLFAGAEQQQAGVTNETVFAGVSNHVSIGRAANILAVSFMTTDFENPFITNFETRQEKTISIRNVIEKKTKKILPAFNWTAGVEGQATESAIDNYGNVDGHKDTLQSRDKVSYGQALVFGGISAGLTQKLTAEISCSGNVAWLWLKNRIFPSGSLDRTFKLQLMPRAALLYEFNQQLNARLVASRGYSLPSLAEIRPSTNIPSRYLQPENGWNLEGGIRLRDHSARYSVYATGYLYRISDAIVRRVNAYEEEYFLNAGSTLQPGAELSFYALLIESEKNFLRLLQVESSWSESLYTFNEYTFDDKNLSGKRMTGVPEKIISNRIIMRFPGKFQISVEHYFCSTLPLNDENTAYADQYHLLDASVENLFTSKKFAVRLAAGIKNILDEFYSSGNDLNAAGNRYYNPAPGRNYSFSFCFMRV